MNALPDTLRRHLPPLWLTLTLAVVVAAGLLWAFVELLRQNVRAGENLRHWQRAGVVRQMAGSAQAAPRVQAPQMATTMSPQHQR